MQCIDCPHMKSLENSEDELVYLCVNREADAYLEETGLCGNCDWDGYDDCGEFFHVTPRSNIPNIRRNGLVPSCGKRSQNCSEDKKSIFMFHCQEDMETALMNWLGEEFDGVELAILKIRLPKSYESDLSFTVASYEVLCEREIPVDYIRFYDEEMNEFEEEKHV